MNWQILIAIIAVASMASISNAYGQTATQQSRSVNIYNITVDCGNGTQQMKHVKHSPSQVNINLNVTCSGGGGGVGQRGPPGIQGPPGLPGKNGLNGQNATITIETTNGTVISTGNSSQQMQMKPEGSSILSPPLIAH